MIDLVQQYIDKALYFLLYDDQLKSHHDLLSTVYAEWTNLLLITFV